MWILIFGIVGIMSAVLLSDVIKDAAPDLHAALPWVDAPSGAATELSPATQQTAGQYGVGGLWVAAEGADGSFMLSLYPDAAVALTGAKTATQMPKLTLYCQQKVPHIYLEASNNYTMKKAEIRIKAVNSEMASTAAILTPGKITIGWAQEIVPFLSDKRGVTISGISSPPLSYTTEGLDSFAAKVNERCSGGQ